MRGNGIRTRPKWAALLLILLLISLLASACKSGSGNPDAAAARSAPISIMVPLHQTQPPSDDLIHTIEAQTGTTLNIDWVPNEIYREKIINAMEANLLRKVTYINQSDYVLVKNAIRSNVFWEIGPYLEQYPNLKKLDKSILKETAIDNKIYGLFSERPASRQGILIRKDWLDRLHMKEPETIDDLYQVFKRFTNDDPDGDGRMDTIGLADRNDLTFGAFKTLASYFGTPNNWGIDSAGKLAPDFTFPEYVDTMNFMKKLYKEDLINKDFAVTSKQVQRYMLISGKAGVYIGSMADAPRLSDEMKKLDANAELTLVNRIRGPKGYGVWSIPDFSGLFLFSKKAIPTEEELKQVLAFFDRTMDADVANLLEYGIEGRHYEVQDGRAVISSQMNQLRNLEVLPLNMLQIANLSNPNVLKLSDAGQDPLLLRADRLSEDNSRMLIRDPVQNLSSPTYDAQGSALSQIITNATYNYILGQIDLNQFRSEIAKWKSRGGDAIISEYEMSKSEK